MGTHWAKLNTALKPRNIFIEINKNHIKYFTQPSESLSSVMANADLLQIVATMANVVATSPYRMILEKLAGGTSHECFP
jgi:hypothetical protein